MATASELQKKLQSKLRELFQLDQPDLDFGFYRVMHAKQNEISSYLDEKLPATIAAAFADTGKAKLQQDFDDARSAVIAALGASAIDDDGTLNAAFSGTPAGKDYLQAKAALESGSASAQSESDVYDHLYHFFERYYDKGDFVSLRYLTRETAHKAKPYAIPYAGEEVMLHWANSDQYYIKTSENFSRFSFDAARHRDVEKMDAMARLAANVPETLKVHFEIVDADEGDHGNIKAGKDRFFILHSERPCVYENGEITVYFEFRDDPEMTGQVSKWQEKRRGEALEALKTALAKAGVPNALIGFLYLDLDNGIKGKPPRILLEVYLKRYFARNTSDYFIHKDLGGFLRRELDFYIKNDLMILDDVAAATPESVAKWLGTLKVFRSIAEDIISFLAQLENFQKKLWLKKKFVVQCDYCITMDRVPSELHAEVLANKAQLEEWKKLGIEADPKSADMMAVDARMVDTKFFSESFKQKLIASIDDFDAQCDGLLIHSENFHALRFAEYRYGNQVKSVYADPPYNTSASEILYKNNYKHSSWLSLIFNGIVLGKKLLSDDGIQCTTIDDVEQCRLSLLLESVYGEIPYAVNIRIKPSGRPIPNGFALSHEYALFSKKSTVTSISRMKHSEEQRDRYRECDEKGPFLWELLRKAGSNSFRENRPTMYYPFIVNCATKKVRVPAMKWNEGKQEYELLEVCKDDETIVYPLKDDGKEGRWYYGLERAIQEQEEIKAEVESGKYNLYRRRRANDGVQPTTSWMDSKYSATEHGTDLLKRLFGEQETFSYPKSIFAVIDCLIVSGVEPNAIVLDYFGGSGTTAHAVISLNRDDGGKRKYILVEMGDHFDTVLKPRIEKVVYSPDWKDGKPVDGKKGISHCFKYLRLESYEDALNNLEVDTTKSAAFSGVSDYFLSYMLDVETKESPSLLNVAEIVNPFGCKLMVKKPASEEREERTVDLVETFNYLIGLRVKRTFETRRYSASFERPADEELPEDSHTKLVVKGSLKLASDDAEGDVWRFRMVEGWVPRNRATPNDGAKDKVLVVWRTLTDDREKDNAVLNAFLRRNDVNALDGEYDIIYVNGSNNVPNLRKDGDAWKVRLIEEDFQSRMWEDS